MRVCHVVEAGGSGCGQVVLDLVNAGVEAGDDVTLIYAPDRAEDLFLAELAKLEHRARLLPLSMERAVGSHDIRALWLLRRLLVATGPYDVVHSHSSKAGALARLSRIFGVKAAQIYTPHAFVTMAPDSTRVYRWIEWLLHWCGDCVIAVSAQEKEHAISVLRISETRITVVPNGIQVDYPADRGSARSAFGFEAGAFVLGFVGRLVAQKNPLRMIDVFVRAGRVDGGLHLVVVGEGPLRGEMQRAIDGAGMTSRVRFMGPAKARDLMPGFDALLCTSEYESFGLVLLEALAAGVPLVTTDVGVAREVVVEGLTGYRTSFSTDDLVAAVHKLRGWTASDRVGAQPAMQATAARFSRDVMTTKTFALYSEILRKRAARTQRQAAA
jgi:glycosyltransferase involved in cell wall biosynthesis